MASQRHFRLVSVLVLVLAVFLPAYAQEAPLNGFDDYVNKALRDWEVPGLAIAGFFIQFEIAENKVKSLTLVQGSGPSLVLLKQQ
jgi:hypothetical protein